MTLYLVHGNTCFSGYGYEGHVFGIFTDEETAEMQEMYSPMIFIK